MCRTNLCKDVKSLITQNKWKVGSGSRDDILTRKLQTALDAYHAELEEIELDEDRIAQSNYPLPRREMQEAGRARKLDSA